MRKISCQFGFKLFLGLQTSVFRCGLLKVLLFILVLNPSIPHAAAVTATDAEGLHPQFVEIFQSAFTSHPGFGIGSTLAANTTNELGQHYFTDRDNIQYVKVAARYKKKYKKRRYTRRSKRKKRRKKSRKNFAGVEKIRKGPVQIFVSLSKQRINVYRDGQRIASSKISSGKRGHRTPTGVFGILQKHRRHYSNLYRGAPMPYMQRLTWSGIALHAGHVPNYPASHGCIRLPSRFAKFLFSMTKMGGHVIVGHEMEVPEKIEHAGLFQPTTVASLSSSTGQIAKVKSEPPRESSIEDNQKSSWEKVGLISMAPLYKVVHRYVLSAKASETVDQLSPEIIRLASFSLMDFENEVSRRQAIASKNSHPLRILITRRTGPERIAEMQRTLTRLGFDTGKPDGYVGRNTVVAIKAFQVANNLKVTGEFSDTLIAKIFETAGVSESQHAQIYVKQKYKELFSAPVKLKYPEKPLGTHMFTVMNFEKNSNSAVWNAVTIKERKSTKVRSRKGWKGYPLPVADDTIVRREVLERIELPLYVETFISDRLTPGSSMIISDNGISHETGKYTDYIVLTR